MTRHSSMDFANPRPKEHSLTVKNSTSDTASQVYEAKQQQATQALQKPDYYNTLETCTHHATATQFFFYSDDLCQKTWNLYSPWRNRDAYKTSPTEKHHFWRSTNSSQKSSSQTASKTTITSLSSVT